MKTEKDIRKFIQDNAPELHGNDRFMADLVRQIDLLPVPASMAGRDRDVESEIRLVREIARTLKRRNLRTALGIIALAVIVCIPVAMCWLGFPVISETLSEYRYYIFGAVTILVLAISFVKIKTLQI